MSPMNMKHQDTYFLVGKHTQTDRQMKIKDTEMQRCCSTLWWFQFLRPHQGAHPVNELR